MPQGLDGHGMHVSFRGVRVHPRQVLGDERAQGEQLVVEGVIQLHTLGADEQARVRDLHLRAFFQPQDGQPVLTHLVAEKLQ